MAALIEHTIPFDSPVIPPRSLLISPVPIGLGSAVAESLFSYFCRVALQNGLTPGQLIFGRCVMLLAQEHDGAAVLRRTARAALARRTVGVSETGYEFAEALAKLAGRPEVVRLHWQHALNGYSFARMTRDFDAYCPDCLRSDLEPHSLMTWELELFGACPEHGCLLVSRCGRCGRRASRLDLSGKLWECPLCGHDRRLDRAPPAASAEIASSKELGALVAEATAAKSADFLAAPDCFDGLLDWAGTHGALSVKRLAKFFAISVGTVSLWRNKRSRPTATRLIELALRRRLPLPAVFRGKCGEITHSPKVSAISAVWKRRSLTHVERLDLKVRTEALALNTYLSMGAGGELELWNLAPPDDLYETARRTDKFHYAIRGDLLPPPDVVIRPEPGSFVLFNAEKLHRVRPVRGDGARVTVSAFAAFFGLDEPLELFS